MWQKNETNVSVSIGMYVCARVCAMDSDIYGVSNKLSSHYGHGRMKIISILLLLRFVYFEVVFSTWASPIQSNLVLLLYIVTNWIPVYSLCMKIHRDFSWVPSSFCYQLTMIYSKFQCQKLPMSLRRRRKTGLNMFFNRFFLHNLIILTMIW